MNTTQNVAQAFSNIHSGITTLREAGFEADFRIISTTPDQNKDMLAKVLETMTSLKDEAQDSTQEHICTSTHQAQAVNRLEAATWQILTATPTRRNSGGFRLDSEGETHLETLPLNHHDGFGFVNVYANSFGRDVHSTLENAKKYATPSTVVGQLKVRVRH